MLGRPMSDVLSELSILAVDCQASGSTPAYGDLLELGWAVCTSAGVAGPVRSRWIVRRTERPVPRAVRELTGWTEACAAEAVEERQAWTELRADVARLDAGAAATPAPTVIHFAQFELRFLRDVCGRVDGGGDDVGFPLDVVCLHAIAARLFPDLPRRNIRALAGYLGHSPELSRRAAGHVDATAFIWRAMLPLLEQASIRTWGALKAWLDQPAPRPRRAGRTYPFSTERRRALPDRPGVYRFLRRNGDILYVGKAASVNKRIAGHFTHRGPATERGLELLTQVSDIDVTETASLLEAALLETDEIKRLDPPYNVQLRAGDRQAWFASRELTTARPTPDAAHAIGPLPSEHALTPLAALIALAAGAAPSPTLCAWALGVPPAFLPATALFDDGYRAFAAEHLDVHASAHTPAARVTEASRALWLLRGRTEPEAEPGAASGTDPTDWDLARVRRRLERALVGAGLLRRRARFLCLLSHATVAFRERNAPRARGLVIAGGAIRDRFDLDDVRDLARTPSVPLPPHAERQSCFDATTYDRLRVLLTELHRIHAEQGQAALRLGPHLFPPTRLPSLLLTV